MTLLGCLAALVAMAFAYLGSRQQRWLAKPLGRRARALAWLFVGVALLAWIAAETSLPGFACALTALMAGAVAWPYVTWLFRPAAARAPR